MKRGKHDDHGRPTGGGQVQAQTRRDTHATRGVANLRVAIAHEWLVRYAGSERCVAEMLAAFPDADLLTTVLEASALPAALRAARPSFLQLLPGRDAPSRVALAPDAARLASAARRGGRRRRDLEQSRVRESGSHRAGDPAPLLLPYADALRMGLRRRERGDSRVRSNRSHGPGCGGSGVGTGRLRDRVTRFVANSSRGRRTNRESVRAGGRCHPPARAHGLLHAGRRT